MLADSDLNTYKLYTIINKLTNNFNIRSCNKDLLLTELMKNQFDEFFYPGKWRGTGDNII